MFKFKTGCEVPFGERIKEGFEMLDGKIRANVSAEKVSKMMTDFIDMHDEPLFMILEVPTNEHEESKCENGRIEKFHRDVYYLDGCSQDRAKAILDEFGELLINDGLCTFGFGGHYSNDEIIFGKYNVMTVFAKDTETNKAVFEKNEVERAEVLVTAWETFSSEHCGISHKNTINGEDVYTIIDKLKEKGLYFAERREEN